MALQGSTLKCVLEHLIRCEKSHNFHQNENQMGRVSFLYQGKISLKSTRNFGERVLSIFLAKIMAATSDFNGSGRLGRRRNLYQGEGTFPPPRTVASISK